MGFRAGLKNPGKWFRVNELVRNNSAIKDAFNTDAFMISTLTAMNEILQAERNLAGIPESAFTETLQTQGFPLPLRIWQGRLVFSHRAEGETGETVNQQHFRQRALELRKRADELTRAFSMLSDAYEKPDDSFPNPGGVVGEGGGTP